MGVHGFTIDQHTLATTIQHTTPPTLPAPPLVSRASPSPPRYCCCTSRNVEGRGWRARLPRPAHPDLPHPAHLDTPTSMLVILLLLSQRVESSSSPASPCTPVMQFWYK